MENFSNILSHGEYKVYLTTDKNGNKVVRKEANGSDASKARLVMSVEKQKKLYNSIKYFKNISVPNILHYSWLYFDKPKQTSFSIDGGYWFDMEYYNSHDYIEFTEISDIKTIYKYLDNIIDFIDINIKHSLSIHYFDHTDLFLRKYEDLRMKLWGEINFKKLDNIFENINRVFVPHGPNHGDLTFSNMLFKRDDDNVVLIDFLACFLESPMNDIIKLRQDTKHKWIFNVYNRDVDVTRMNILFNKLDDIIHKHFSKYNFYLENERIFSILNLLRIYPYAKNNEIKKYILKELEEKYGV